MAVMEIGIVLLTEVINGIVLRFILDPVHLCPQTVKMATTTYSLFFCSQNFVYDPIKPAVYQFHQQFVKERKYDLETSFSSRILY